MRANIFTLRLSDDELAALTRLAQREALNMNDWVRREITLQNRLLDEQLSQQPAGAPTKKAK